MLYVSFGCRQGQGAGGGSRHGDEVGEVIRNFPT